MALSEDGGSDHEALVVPLCELVKHRSLIVEIPKTKVEEHAIG